MTASAGILGGLAGCLTGRFDSHFLHGFKQEVSEENVVEIATERYGVGTEDIYVNEAVGAVQIMGNTVDFEGIALDIGFEVYEVHSALDYVQSTNTETTDSSSVLSEMSDVSERASGGEFASIGILDTTANWDDWADSTTSYETKDVAQNRNPVIGPIFGDTEHGELTAKTLAHPRGEVSNSELTGVLPNSDFYHSELSRLSVISQFFRSFCDSLEWFASVDVDIAVIPLSTGSSDYVVFPRILEYFSEEYEIFSVISTGNTSVCTVSQNSLSYADSQFVISVGGLRDSKFVGPVMQTDIYSPTGYTVDGTNYSGSSGGAVSAAGLFGLYHDITPEPTHSKGNSTITKWSANNYLY